MSISCPAARLPVERMPAFGEKVMAAARSISQQLSI
jgi:DNA-binding IclR family transcriptional regulator